MTMNEMRKGLRKVLLTQIVRLIVSMMAPTVVYVKGKDAV
jgi:hypothetical protein